LQHCLDVVAVDGVLYVADTYNNKIKRIDPAESASTTLVGTGQPGKADEPPQFDEPAGLAYAGGKLYVADTNNHLVRTIDLKNGSRVATLPIKGLAPPKLPAVEPASPGFPGAVKLTLAPAKVKPLDGKLRFQVELKLPEGHKLNKDAPMRYLVEAAGTPGPIEGSALGKLQAVQEPAVNFPIDLPLTGRSGQATLSVSLGFYYCQERAEGICKAASVIWKAPIRLDSAAAKQAVTLSHTVR
jgi:hypothetical protein